jgi:pyruvate dehydrogenase E2 component (dihydrolipoamide acetyltransferase)
VGTIRQENEMAFEVFMPRLGWNMEKGSLAEWRKKDGDYVEEGEILFTVESDKAIQEVEALESGVLRILPDSPPPGKEVSVGTLLAYLVKPGESVPFEAGTVMPTPGGTSLPLSSASAPEPKVPESSIRQPETPSISPRARRMASELGVDWTDLKGSGRTGRIVEKDVRQAAALSARTGERVSPLARRLAEDLGVDLEQLAARMPGQRIGRADVEAAAREAASIPPTPAMPVSLPSVSASSGKIVPIGAVRRTIAERMSASAHTAAAITLTTEVDATELVRLRTQLKDDGSQAVPSYNDLLAKLVAVALTEHPMVNARFEGDSIVQLETVNIGIAVDTERGLLVPVVRDAQVKSLRQIAAESVALIEKAREGRISPDELHGGTFTITNLGMYEIDAFTPIINLPECAILGVGRIVAKQVVMDAESECVSIRRMMFLSLTFDHRLVDGAPAARFLQRVKQYVENPYLWLVV